MCIRDRIGHPALKAYAKDSFPDSKADLFAMFMERGFGWCKPSGFNSMVTMQSWMFLSSYEAMREKLLTQRTIQTMAHLGARAFGEISGEVVQTTAFVLQGQHFSGFKPVFFRLVDGQEAEKEAALRGNQNRFDATVQDDFKKIPGSPVAYWVSRGTFDLFMRAAPLGQISTSVVGQNTGDNDLFLRRWFEVSFNRISFHTKTREETFSSFVKWYPYNKGGQYKKWYGNFEYVVNWQNDAEEIKKYAVIRNDGKHWSRYIQNLDYVFREAITWSDVTSGNLSCRYLPPGFISDVSGPSAFFDSVDLRLGLSILNSKFIQSMAKILNPTIHFQAGNYRTLPYFSTHNSAETIDLISRAIKISKEDWDQFEVSWDFRIQPILGELTKKTSLKSSWFEWQTIAKSRFSIMHSIEKENNRLFINAYGLQDELSPEVPESEITLTRADREKDCQRLISYAIGCMMGRYSLDAPGLIYAHAGNVGFDPSRYPSFPCLLYTSEAETVCKLWIQVSI